MAGSKQTFVVGERLGVSPWLEVTQEMITGFGASTLDPDPMHIDPEWAEKNSPYGKTIAFGFQTMAMLSRLLYEAQSFNPERAELGESHIMNYGFDRLRLVSPVLVGSRIRGVFEIKATEADNKGNEKVVITVTVEIEGEERPALVGDWVVIHVPVDASSMASAS